VDVIPHFLLLLLILQRFDDARWGYFKEHPLSGMEVEPGMKSFTVSSVADEEADQRIMIVPYPDDHGIYLGTTLIGRGTGKDSHQYQRSSAIRVTFEREMTSSSRSTGWMSMEQVSWIPSRRQRGEKSTSPAIYVSLLTIRAACVSDHYGRPRN
jgi:hypothetical protein